MVEVQRSPGSRKDIARALVLLDSASERYDLVLEKGQTVARGIFLNGDEPDLLSELLNQASASLNGKVFVRGEQLETPDVKALGKMLACASKKPPCRSENKNERWSFLGCHLVKIRLIDYSLQTLKGGGRFWFSFLRKDTTCQGKWTLGKFELLNAFWKARLCPLFPQETGAMIERLPEGIDLERKTERTLWVETGRMLGTRWLCRFPPVIPYSETKYRQWISSVIGV
jgi:hypothetical protein